MIGSSNQSSARLPPSPQGNPEFRVRFSRTGGPWALFGTSANRFRWSGYETLRVHEYGVVICARHRNLMGLYGVREQPLQAREICDVYREGASVRIHLRSASSRDSFFQFWAEDAATAATIVRLLPTTRTFELEGTADDNRSSRNARDPLWRRVSTGTWVFLGILGLIAAVTWLTGAVSRRYAPATTVSQSILESVPARPPARDRAPSAPAPIPATPAAFTAANDEFEHLDTQFDSLKVQFARDFTALQYGSLSQQGFAARLNDKQLPQWKALLTQLGPDSAGSTRLPASVRLALIDASLDWQGALMLYVRGLGEQDTALVLTGFDRMKQAEELQRRARQLLEQLEPQTP